MKKPIAGFLTAVLAFAMAMAAPALAADEDPLAVRALAPPSQLGSFAPGRDAQPCRFPEPGGAQLSLAQIVDRALCNNPQTRAAWASARAQAAQVGVARSAFFPSLNASVSGGANRNEAASGAVSNFTQESAGLSAGYVLFDFGARDAALQSALEALTASNYTQDATLQRVFLAAVQAYFNLFAARASSEAARVAERAGQESLKAAEARYAAGTGTPADRLQAQTAYSQATLNRIQAQGNERSAEGVLANAIGLDAGRPLALAMPDTQVPDTQFDSNVENMIAAARKRRPDLAAAEAQVRAAEANIEAARAAGKPTVSLSANLNLADTSIARTTNSQAIGITLSIPIFSGYGPTYRVEAARAQAENQQAQRDTLSLQVALDVWQAHAALTTGTQAVRSSADLVASATASERVALGRYQAGVGNIIDVLTAQTALANARQQNIQAIYNWHIARATLARAMGQLDVAAMDELRRTP